jgi:hypothetical protein
MTASSNSPTRASHSLSHAAAAPLVGVGAAALLFLYATPCAAAEAYCAFRVRVAAPSGALESGLPVAMVRDNRTTLFEAATDSNGVARFCDAPVGAVDIVVGVDLCGSVVVRQVKAEWPSTREIFVTYAKTFCDHLGVAGDCHVLARIEDESGHPLAGARMEPRGTPPNATSRVSDQFGRLFLSVKRGERVEGLIVKDGFEPTDFSRLCRDNIEPKFVLRRR